jgi:hypothetical protein
MKAVLCARYRLLIRPLNLSLVTSEIANSARVPKADDASAPDGASAPGEA